MSIRFHLYYLFSGDGTIWPFSFLLVRILPFRFELSLQPHHSYDTVFPGLLFAFSFSITYTCARTMSNKYKYDALQTGLVLLAFGIGEPSGISIDLQQPTITVARVLVR